jgi:hypothetical protein
MGNQIAVKGPPAGVVAGMVRRQTVSTGVLLWAQLQTQT